MEKLSFIIDKNNYTGTRIDSFLSEKISHISRSYVKSLIEKKLVLVNDSLVKPSYKLQNEDKIQVTIPDPENLEILPQKIDIEITYEDSHVLVVNKPQGMVVHPAPGNYENTLVNSLLYHINELSNINGVLRPGIVHRIDKDTSGLLLVAKTDKAHKSLSEQLKAHTIQRKYMALVEGVIPEDNGTIDAPIGRDPKNRKKMGVTQYNSKNAITHFSVIKRFSKHTLIEAKLETGRTHQIRVHMSYINHPVVGDGTYGYKKQGLYENGQLLHAYLIGFVHPFSEKYMEFQIPLPDYFQNILNFINVD